MKLFRVETVVREFGPCKNVVFHWTREPKACGRPYAELIADYHAVKDTDRAFYSHMAVDESFTGDEAEQLKAYLERIHGREWTTTISELQLPWPSNVMPINAIPVSPGNNGLYTELVEESTYDLPFDAFAHFEFDRCEFRDGSGNVFHHRYLLVGTDKDGKIVCRPETNEEAAAREAS